MYSDVIVAQNFANKKLNLTKTEINDIKKINRISIDSKITYDGRAAWSTQIMEYPINIMEFIKTQHLSTNHQNLN